MADFMTAVKTVHKATDQAPDPLLTPFAIRQEKRPQKASSETDEKKNTIAVKSPEDALQLLRSEPDVDGLIKTLHLLSLRHGLSQDFDIRAPGPLQAQIVNALVTIIAPTFWPVLDQGDRSVLLSCLRCAAGPSAMVARLRLLCDEFSRAKPSDADCQEQEIILSMLNDATRSDDVALRIWMGLVEAVSHDVKRQMAWKDFIGLVASGKLTATIARSEDILRADGRKTMASSLLSSGVETSAWLGRNIGVCMQQSTNVEAADLCGATAQLFSRSFGLGYAVSLTKAFWMSMISDTASLEQSLRGLDVLLQRLPSHTKQTLLESSLNWLSERTDSDTTGRDSRAIQRQIRGLAALVDALIKPDPSMQQHLVELLNNPVASTLTTSARRACITVVAANAPSELETLLGKLMGTFGEKVFVDHAPIVQQEAIAQSLLLTAGHVHRKTPMALLMTTRSSGHMQSVSSRLHSSNQRARWLGMVVGTAISSLVDKEGSQMNFGTDDMQSEEARWYQQLVRAEGHTGTIADLEEVLKKQRTVANGPRKAATRFKTQKLPIINGKQTFGPAKPPVPVQTEVVGDKITEIEDDEDDEDDDLKPYAKPDSDPEDSDEDATLINRNKTRPPVYIRDLMRMLKETENPGKFQMAIKHAPALIRRKSNFGNEVKDHAEELALMLCDIRDPFETEGFDELKLQTLIAIVLTDVKKMGPWLSRQAFAGEYSLSQRCIMLSALGLGGRELAGYKADDLNPTLAEGVASFPSKRLPGRLHAIYSPTDGSVGRLESASKNIEHQLIKPLALSAADKTTSHLDAVKVRTFSSRMDVERTKRKPAANELAKVFGEYFFFPLLSRYQQEIAAYGPGSVFVSAPFVQVTFLKTLALLLHAAGPATMSLPEITTAFWDLLLSLRVQAISDISVLEAVLFSLLTLLEVNTDSKQRLAQETPKQLMETQQWTEVVFEKTGGGNLVTEGSDEEARVRTLSAGVLVKTKEVIEAYQKLLIGNTYG